MKKGVELKEDGVLADRTGFITIESGNAAVFTFDGLGRNIDRISIRLLPCQALEIALEKQSTKLEPVRFKVAGVVSEYRKEKYLLLQRATTVYSFGNFAR